MDRDKFKSELVSAVRQRDLQKLADLVDFAREQGFTYLDLQTMSGVSSTDWEELMYEIDTMEDETE